MPAAHRLPWPAGFRAAAALTSDVDAESAILSPHPEAAALTILFGSVTIAVLPKANFALAGQAGVAGIGTFVLMTTIVASFNLAWALYAAVPAEA